MICIPTKNDILQSYHLFAFFHHDASVAGTYALSGEIVCSVTVYVVSILCAPDVVDA